MTYDENGAARPKLARDRDASGRARNARPRDGLGRPLPRGASTSIERIPEDLVLPPEESLREAQRLLDAGRPFHAHEILEGTWKAAPPPERDLWQGLAQLAVGLTHIARGNPRGAVTLLRRAHARLSLYATEPPYGVDVAGLLQYTDTLARSVPLTPPPSPRLVTKSGD
jgi:hypothetical protein